MPVYDLQVQRGSTSHEAKSACQPLKGWSTIYDFANAKLEKKNETAKRMFKKVLM